MENISERKRKSKGSLSVLDEFTGDAGAISFTPNVSREIQQQIDEKTRQADAPTTIAAQKVEPIISQSAAKVEAINGISEVKHKPKLSQKVEPKDSLAAKVEPQPEPQVEPIISQSAAKVEPIVALTTLVGLQRNSLLFIYESCRVAGSKISAPVSIQNIAATTETTAAAARKALQRLEQKGFIVRSTYKDGRGGWTQYRLPDQVYNALLINETRAKVEPKLSQTRAKVRTEVEPQLEPSLSSSSRDLYIKESTTTQSVDNFSLIDLSRVQHLGITSSVLARCVELYPSLQPEQLEGLAFRFAEFAKDPKNRVQNARGFFISLAEQASKGQVPLDHIETPDERLMRLFVKQQEEAKSRRVDVERAALEFECETWLESLTPEMKRSLVPETAILKAGSAAHAAMLKNHFTENVWPERRKQILESANTPAVDATL